MEPKDTSLGDANDPLSIVLSGREQQRKMCDRLEAIADHLANGVDRESCLSILDVFSNGLPIFLRDEEAVYELLRLREGENGYVAKWIDHAISEHRQHEDYALELADPLAEIASGLQGRDLDVVGYMLRCAFENIRRHLDWEDITVLGGFVELVTHEDKQTLAAKLARNRATHRSHLRLIP